MPKLTVRESAENYLKTILVLKNELGCVRSIDVANFMNVTKASVSKAMKRLREEGFVRMDEHHELILTEDGLSCASAVFEKHKIVEEFLNKTLGVDEETAHKDSCRIEHLISEDTVKGIQRLSKEFPS